MTSGIFESFPIDSIWVNRETRQRRDLTNIAELAESIRRTGLIHPPVIRRDGELIAGERRWTACKSIGWTSIPVQFVEDLPATELKLIELDENLRRVDITWQDECKAIQEYHAIRAQTDHEWGIKQSAEALGRSREFIQQRLDVAKNLENPKVAQAPKYSVAHNIVKRTNERARTSAIESLKEPSEVPPVPILTADFNEWARSYEGEKFNLIHCDFPYGVNINTSDQNVSANSSMDIYDDRADVYFQLLATLDQAMNNVIHESAHLIFWFSMSYFEETKAALENMGWSVNPFPLIWLKSDNTGLLPDPQRGPRRIYETALFASRGDRKIISAVANAIAAPTTKQYHMSEKPVAVVRHFMRMICDEYSRVLDPTCGGGNALVCARALRAANILGLERDPEFARRAIDNWNARETQ